MIALFRSLCDDFADWLNTKAAEIRLINRDEEIETEFLTRFEANPRQYPTKADFWALRRQVYDEFVEREKAASRPE